MTAPISSILRLASLGVAALLLPGLPPNVSAQVRDIEKGVRQPNWAPLPP